MKLLNHILLVFASILFAAVGSSAQFVTSYDGNVNVSPTTGVLEYEYPLSNLTGDGYTVNVTLRYNSSLVYKRLGLINNDANKEYVYKRNPGWIIGVNGFAVQVLHQNIKPTAINAAGDILTNENDEKTGWMLEGYDYCNRMKLCYEGYRDAIRLLRSDGSVLSLINKNSSADYKSEDFYTGDYYDVSGNGFAQAQVEYDDKYYYKEIKEHNALYYMNECTYRPRVVHLFTGDGLEYTFYEIVDAYGLNIKSKPHYNNYKLPTIFYLERIRSSVGTVATFTRMYHNHDTTNNRPDIHRGRSPMRKIADNTLIWSDDGLVIQNMQRTTTIKFDRIYNHFSDWSNLSKDLLEQKINAVKEYQQNQYYGRNVSNELSTSLEDKEGDYCLMLVKEITDPANRKTVFSYSECHDQIHNSDPTKENPYSSSIIYLLDSIVDPVKVHKFQYLDVEQSSWPSIDTKKDIQISNYFVGDKSNNKGLRYVYSRQNSITEELREYSYDTLICHTQTFTTFPNSILLKDDFQSIYYKYLIVNDAVRCDETPEYIKTKKKEIISSNDHVTGKQISKVIDYIDCNILGSLYPSYVHQERIRNSNGSDVSILYSYNPNEDDDSTGMFYNFIGFQTKETTINGRTFVEETEFKNLPLQILNNVTVPRTEIETNEYRNYLNQCALNGKMSKSIDKTEYMRIHNEFFPKFYVPPVAHIPISITNYEKVNNSIRRYIGGKINVIADSFKIVNGEPLTRYGAILKDYIITPNKDTLLNNTYHYSGGWFRNFLVETENSVGAKSRLFYNYTDVEDAFGDTPIGKVLRNDNSIETVKLTQDHPEYETPIATETQVRKYYYNPFGKTTLDTLKLRTINERTHHGQIQNIVDPNGWLANTIYDSIGRPLLNRLPYDFPTKNIRGIGKDFSQCTPVFNYKTLVIETTDTIETGEDGKKHIVQGDTTIDTISCRMDLGNKSRKKTNPNFDDKVYDNYIIDQTHFDFVLPASLTDAWFSNGSPGSTGSNGPSNPSDPGLPPPTPEPKDSTFYYLDFNATIASVGKADCAFLTLILKYKTGDIDTTHYVINCPDLPDSSVTDTINHTLKIPIRKSILQKIITQSLTHEAITAVLGMDLNSSKIEILADAEDRIPTVCFNHRSVDKYIDDFTTSTEYNDKTLQVKTLAKIDDDRHTGNPNWRVSVLGLEGRYTGGICNTNYNGSEQIAKKWIGNPFSSNDFVTSISNQRVTEQGAFEQFSSPTSELIYKTTIKGNSSVQTILGGDSPDVIKYTESQFVSSTVTYYRNDFKKDSLLYRLLPSFFVSEPIRNQQANDGFIVNDSFYTVPNGAYKKVTTGEDEKSSASYYDQYGQLRLTVANLQQPDSLYSIFVYDSVGNQIKTITNTNDTTKYWYDANNRLLYKYSKDIGFVSYGYNKFGQLRFSQTAEQNMSKKVSYFQYDDLGRSTIVGEAMIDSDNETTIEIEKSTGAPTFKRLTDWLDANNLNTGRSCLPTANPTLWDRPKVLISKFDSVFVLSDTLSKEYYKFPFISPNNVLISHNLNFDKSDTASALPDEFENVAAHPDFVRTVNQFDELPPAAGAVWGNMPIENMKKLSRGGNFSNLLGRKVATAYRDDETQPFRYVAYSYDARGRVVSLVRYTDNIGYDAVYYDYNSADQIIRSITSDAVRSNSIWYSYDDNGRLARIFSEVKESTDSTLGYGLGADTALHPPLLMFARGIPEVPDLVYKYDKTGKLISTQMYDAKSTKNYQYTRRGLLESVIAKTDSGETIFAESVNRTPDGRITKKTNDSKGFPTRIQNFSYGSKNQLLGWTMNTINNIPIADFSYQYDSKGNRLHSTENKFAMGYNNIELSYLPGTNLLSRFANGSTKEYKFYSYNLNGAVVTIDTKGGTNLNEQFEYYASGLTKSYTAEGCELQGSQNWDYQYSGVGGRESKRLNFLPSRIEDFIEHSNSGVITDPFEPTDPHSQSIPLTGASTTNPDKIIYAIYSQRLDVIMGDKPHWTYYLRGAGGEELAQYSGVKNKVGTAVAMQIAFYSVAGELIVAPDGKKSYFVTDLQGNVRCKISGDSTQFFDYTPFGQSLDETYNDANGWIASERDAESKYMNLQARLYDPVIGRFLSVDPLAELQIGITPYHYCGNDPVNACDRSGLLPSSSPGNSGHYGGYSGLNDPDLPSKKGYSDIDIPWDWNWHNFAGIGVDGQLSITAFDIIMCNIMYSKEVSAPSQNGTTSIRILIPLNNDKNEAIERFITVNKPIQNPSIFVMTQEMFNKMNVSGTTYDDLQSRSPNEGSYEVSINLRKFLTKMDKPSLYAPYCETPAVFGDGFEQVGEMHRVKNNEQPNCSESMRVLLRQYPNPQCIIHTHPNDFAGNYQKKPTMGQEYNGKWVENDYSIFSFTDMGIILTSQTICFYSSNYNFLFLNKSYILR